VSAFPLATQRADVQYAWRGPSILVVQNDGLFGQHPLSGFYFRQTRYLKEFSLSLNGASVYPCSVAEIAQNRLEAVFIFPEVRSGDGGGSGSGGRGKRHGVLERSIDVLIIHEVHASFLEISIALTNRALDAVDLDINVAFNTDFATITEAEFDTLSSVAVDRQATGGSAHIRAVRAGSRVRSDVTFAEAEWTVAERVASTHMRLNSQESRTLRISVDAVDEDDTISRLEARSREKKLEDWHRDVASVHVPADSPTGEFATRAQSDLGSLALLEGDETEWLTPAAGVPLYGALWARDALPASWQAALFDGASMVSDVLNRLAKLQGRVLDPERDEQPGRIINQFRNDPLSRGGVTGLDRSYQDVASPFMFLVGYGYHYTITGDKAHLARHWDTAMRIVKWADEYGDRDGDGYIEYLTTAPKGPRHQGWKDSNNAVVRDDGSQVDPPIAPCEIQGYWYVSLQLMAIAAMALHERTHAIELWEKARALKERFNRDFWMDDAGYVAFGLDSNKEQIRALTSNVGQCLPTGILTKEHATRAVRRMFEPDMFSGWGIRTLSTGNPAYNPIEYHLGSVWPVENASALLGLRRYGFNDRVHELASGLYDLARLWPGGRTPECVGGYSREEMAHPGAYSRANRPQTWNQSVWPMMLQSLLGLVAYAPLKTVVVDPMLPAWLPEITLRDLRIGDARLDIRFQRTADGESHYDILQKQGKLRIMRQAWPESLPVNAIDRVRDLISSLAHQ
jgi:glycogen debranching enzyme